ncbi:hypothetical protein RF11_04834 [Thelohanellus kitauei]|uniref:Uncharacterized protein n=1 Tax=Thelohanellus kitauei TaxID=669202 RepID=A0A0C2N6L3_THEKT|nr:hypothetical protein RF11_04834 [Thelohanellus kitauei]
MMKKLLCDLTMGLSDGLYTTKLQQHQKLFLYEDIKSTCISMIPKDFITQIFSEASLGFSEILNVGQPNDLVHAKFKEYNDLFKMIIESFNESPYLDHNKATDYLILCGRESQDLPPLHFFPNITRTISDANAISDTSDIAMKCDKTSFQARLRWFALIFELKFIFGSIRAKFIDSNL